MAETEIMFAGRRDSCVEVRVAQIMTRKGSNKVSMSAIS